MRDVEGVSTIRKRTILNWGMPYGLPCSFNANEYNVLTRGWRKAKRCQKAEGGICKKFSNKWALWNRD